MNILKNENNKIEGFEGTFLHPSFDIKEDVLLLGFRYMTKNRKEKEVFLITNGETVELSSNNSFELNEKQYFLDKKERVLVRIEEKWSLRELNEFAKKYHDIAYLPKSVNPYAKIKELLKKHVELESDIDYSLITAWIVGTYLFPVFSAYSFLNIKAPKRSGKSQCLNFLKQVCFNATKARPSFAALSDTVDSLKGTYLIDQADSLKRKGSEDLVDILADSYKRGCGKRRIMVPDKERRWKPKEFETYGPKVFASIGELPEDLRDRCLIVPLIRSQKNFPEPNEEDENWKKIRAYLYNFLIENYITIKSIYDVRKTAYRIKPEIAGRELELWLPLQVIIEFLAPEEVEKAKKRFLHLYGYAEYEPSELEEETIKTILELIGEASEIVLSPKKISENINLEVFPAQDDTRQKTAKIGWTIRKFNLSSEKKPRTKEGVSYLFNKNKVEKIHNSYLKTAENNLTSPTLVEKNDLNTENFSQVKKDVKN